MNIEKIESLFTPSICCLIALEEDVYACLSILKECWHTPEIITTLNEAKVTFEAYLKKHCISTCTRCKNTLLAIFKRLDDVGLDEVFFNLLTARQNLKKTLKKSNP